MEKDLIVSVVDGWLLRLRRGEEIVDIPVGTALRLMDADPAGVEEFSLGDVREMVRDIVGEMLN